MQSILWPHLFATPEMSAGADSGVETCFLDEKKTASLKRVRKMRTAAGPKFQKRNARPTETGRKARRKRAKCAGISRRFWAPPGHMDDMCNARSGWRNSFVLLPFLKCVRIVLVASPLVNLKTRCAGRGAKVWQSVSGRCTLTFHGHERWIWVQKLERAGSVAAGRRAINLMNEPPHVLVVLKEVRYAEHFSLGLRNTQNMRRVDVLRTSNMFSVREETTPPPFRSRVVNLHSFCDWSFDVVHFAAYNRSGDCFLELIFKISLQQIKKIVTTDSSSLVQVRFD